MQRSLIPITLKYVLAAFISGSSLAAFSVSAETAEPARFLSIYDKLTAGSVGHERELEKQADQEMLDGNFTEACATYLASAKESLRDRSFEQARPRLDKMFIAAAKLRTAEQKQLFIAVRGLHCFVQDTRPSDVQKYLAQQKLNLIEAQPNSTADDRFESIADIANACAQNREYSRSESVLVDVLKDLRTTNPKSKNIETCELLLGRIYDWGKQPQNAKQYYEDVTSLARQRSQPEYVRALASQTEFLLRNKMYDEGIPLAKEYFDLASASIELKKTPSSFEPYAHNLADADIALADKFYRAAFDSEKMSPTYTFGHTVAEWAKALHEHGKTSETMAVLKEGMDYCKSSKNWVLEKNLTPIAQLYEKYLREANQRKEADEFRAEYLQEMAARSSFVSEWLSNTAQRTQKPPPSALDKVLELTSSMKEAFQHDQCETGYNLLQQAILTYEANADNKDSPKMYASFTDISNRLISCGRPDEVRPILMQIIRARMIFGFERFWQGFHGFERDDRTALAELLSFDTRRAPGEKDVLAALDELISEAKLTGKPGNVDQLLTRRIAMTKSAAEKAALSEELETWIAKEGAPTYTFEGMLRTAEFYIAADQFDKATEKWKAAIEMRGKSPTQLWDLDGIARRFAEKSQLSRASDCYLVALKLGTPERLRDDDDHILKGINTLASKFRDADDIAGGGALLDQALAICKDKDGEDSTIVREQILKVAQFYAISREKAKVKTFCDEYLALIDKPGRSVSTLTIVEMNRTTQILKNNGCGADAQRLNDLASILEANNCKVPASAR
ncbi:MAG TPA: hypothetical protein V6C81_25745 [Planktothrix sp.]|jgi:hypothetical protein